jgi:hypothetical protein
VHAEAPHALSDPRRPGGLHEQPLAVASCRGQTITVAAESHQLPLFVRVGSSVNPGDLEGEWQQSLAIARTRPNLAALERSVNEWFGKNGGPGGERP